MPTHYYPHDVAVALHQRWPTEAAPPPDPDEEQLALLPAPARARAVVRRTTPPRERTPDPVAEVDPVARVLVDVPCSSSGVLMKRVAARYRLNPDAVGALERKQLELLERGASAVRPGGVLVYATCSVLPSENTGVVGRFLQRQGAAFVL